MSKPKRTPPCGDPECSCSTGIHDDDSGHGLTFGSGELDFYGYWEKPCGVCAREHERLDGVPAGTYWPFPAVLESVPDQKEAIKP